jgi:hypothetical protein
VAVVSVDLAYRDYRDVGVAVLDRSNGRIVCDLVAVPLRGRPAPAVLAAALNDLCVARGARFLLLDGPQGWKAADNGLVHSRVCERRLNTPAKTGETGSVKPANYTPFVAFSVDVFDALTTLGWQRLGAIGGPLAPEGRWLVESFPLSAWRALGITPLPSKARTRPEDIRNRLDLLRELAPIDVRGVPTHDELQALVAGLAGVALESGDWQACEVAGLPPCRSGDVWVEGFIVNPRRPVDRRTSFGAGASPE